MVIVGQCWMLCRARTLLSRSAWGEEEEGLSLRSVRYAGRLRPPEDQMLQVLY
jgi:hypothetical protein